MDWMLIGLLLVLAFGANLPLGWWRRYQRRFSPAWFLAIHASIPALIATRIAFGISYWVIPLELAAAVAGQVGGSRLALRQTFSTAPWSNPRDESSRRGDDERRDPR